MKIKKKTDTGKIGIIVGTLFDSEKFLGKLRKMIIVSKHGFASPIYTRGNLVLMLRHKSPGGGYRLPHCINYPANIAAFRKLGVQEVVAVASSGSLKKNIPPDSLVIPSDFLSLYPLPTAITKAPRHPTPRFDTAVRQRLVAATIAAGYDFFDGGVYWQTPGPRLETRAEITAMSSFVDIVGMTIAAEATLCAEMNLPYAVICSVDNYAHGIEGKPLDAQDIASSARRNSAKIIAILKQYLANFLS